MRSLFYALVTGLAGAAVLHIIIILSVPRFTGRDAHARISALGVSGQVFVLDAKPNDVGLSRDDPFVETAVCAIDISERPVHLRAAGTVDFWSYAIFDDGSNEVFSMNDASAVAGQLDTIIATPAQLNVIRKDSPDIASRSILVEMAAPEGYVVLRTLVAFESQRPAARRFLSDASCDWLGG